MDHGFSQLAGHSDHHTGSAAARYQPSTADVFKVKRYLQTKFPEELIDRIIDDASYWPHSSVYLEYPFMAQTHVDEMYMRTLPLGIPGTEGDFSLVESDLKDGGAAWTRKLTLGETDGPSRPRLSHPCRKIEFQLWHPNMWFGSYTRYDASVQKLQASIFADNIIGWPVYLLFESDEKICGTPTDHRPQTLVHANFVASSRTMERTIVCHYIDSCDNESAEVTEVVNKEWESGTLGGKFVRDMEVGDCIILWPRALYPGWMNRIEKAKITTYWAV